MTETKGVKVQWTGACFICYEPVPTTVSQFTTHLGTKSTNGALFPNVVSFSDREN